MPKTSLTKNRLRPVRSHAGELTPRERLVLSILRRDGQLSRSALIKSSGLSGTAIFRATEDLSTRGLIQRGDPVAQGRGQPSHRVSLDPDGAFGLGLAVMTDTAEAVLIDATGIVRASRDVSAEGMRRTEVLGNTAQFLDEVSGDLPVTAENLTGLGIAVAGFFVEPDSTALNTAAELDDWALMEIGPDAEELLGLPVTVENIANAAAVGEQLLGVGQDHGTFAYVSIASGFGGGVILDGQSWRGAHGNAGEFATLLKEAGAEVPNLETLRRHLNSEGIKTTSVRDLLDRFDPTWPGLEEWVLYAAPSIRLLAILIHATLDIETLVLGGRLPPVLAKELAAAAQIDITERQARIRRGVPHPNPTILPAIVSAQAATIGAASIPLAQTLFTSVAGIKKMG